MTLRLLTHCSGCWLWVLSCRRPSLAPRFMELSRSCLGLARKANGCCLREPCAACCYTCLCSLLGGTPHPAISEHVYDTACPCSFCSSFRRLAGTFSPASLTLLLPYTNSAGSSHRCCLACNAARASQTSPSQQDLRACPSLSTGLCSAYMKGQEASTPLNNKPLNRTLFYLY